MRKSAKCVLAALLTLCFAGNVNAAECSYEKQVKLNDIASTVKATYEEVEIDTGDTTYYVDPNTGAVDTNKIIPIKEVGFNLKIINMTNNIYIVANNITTGETKTYYYSDSNKGTINLGQKMADEIYTYKFQILSTDNECPGINLRTIDLVLPRYNYFSELEVCEKYPEYSYCQRFLTNTQDIDYMEFEKGIENYKQTTKNEEIKKKKEENLKNKIKRIIEENKIIILITTVVVVAGVATTAIIVNKRRSRLI